MDFQWWINWGAWEGLNSDIIQEERLVGDESNLRLSECGGF